MKAPMDDNGKLKCSIEYTLKKIGGKWKTVILWHLSVDGTLRYNALRSLLPGISHKVLSQQLKELEEDGFIIRFQYDTVPPKVEYSITEMGKTLIPILEQMHKWGTTYGDLEP
ncbi:winged helix-turn-helix transcriptional regulator [Halobacillus litoralis]|uniref:winged helix-turn-helix transcriptional regulator n=1 Tax=Halobacillus litoralis TaxID=45668 RepID=UPI001368D2D2|nr:helix-turn-helix domain-containing protein [Halobacillus litoralis]MCA1023578.1 helix-turn-helix transcriptional regulator [Halobacillus litoralis]MYL39644.1 transcriptional regulator [Halobacillus litoralis]